MWRWRSPRARLLFSSAVTKSPSWSWWRLQEASRSPPCVTVVSRSVLLILLLGWRLPGSPLVVLLVVLFPIRPFGDASDGKVSYWLCEAVAEIKGAFTCSLPLRAFGRERPASWGILKVY